jgi:hypothetical protein
MSLNHFLFFVGRRPLAVVPGVYFLSNTLSNNLYSNRNVPSDFTKQGSTSTEPPAGLSKYSSAHFYAKRMFVVYI